MKQIITQNEEQLEMYKQNQDEFTEQLKELQLSSKDKDYLILELNQIIERQNEKINAIKEMNLMKDDTLKEQDYDIQTLKEDLNEYNAANMNLENKL